MKTASRRFRSGPLVLLTTAFVAGAAGSTPADQEAKSAATVKELTQLLDQAQLDCIASKDPAQPDHFVAALYIAGAQLLVVSARYSAPTLLDDRIGKKEYREVYVDLNSASIPDSKSFVEDGGADGLKAKRDDNDPLDRFEKKGKQFAFDGDWKKQKLSEADYMKAFGEADDEYIKLLQILIGQLKARK